MKNKKLKIIAGPCAIDQDNLAEIYEIAEIKTPDGKRAISGARAVGLKSRSALNSTGEGMGVDYKILYDNYTKLMNGKTVKAMRLTPALEMAIQIVKDTNMLVAAEIMMPIVQLPLLEGLIPANKLLAWNPSVNQLGWQVMEMTEYAHKNGWYVGLKNGKWIGHNEIEAQNRNDELKTPIEKTWEGLTQYAQKANGHTLMIHRGFELNDKEGYRAKPIHEIARRTKIRTGKPMLFDPSHSYGPGKRDEILEGTIKAMNMKLNDEEYLYDGILIEAGTSVTDTDQHVTIAELKDMVKALSKTRDLQGPE